MARVTDGLEETVDRQVDAYNARDVDAFVACYDEAVVVEDAEGRPVMNGRDEVREAYGRLFEESPDLRAEVVSRMRVGSYVVDEERITGRSGEDVHAVVIYHLNGGLIDRARILR